MTTIEELEAEIVGLKIRLAAQSASQNSLYRLVVTLSESHAKAVKVIGMLADSQRDIVTYLKERSND